MCVPEGGRDMLSDHHGTNTCYSYSSLRCMPDGCGGWYHGTTKKIGATLEIWKGLKLHVPGLIQVLGQINSRSGTNNLDC